MKQYYSIHPEYVKNMDTAKLRENFLIPVVFEEEKITMSYAHDDRFIVIGAQPVKKELSLIINKEIGSEFFLERREAGIINIGGEGIIICDGVEYPMSTKDGIYLGKGVTDISFKSIDSSKPAKFYIVSGSAHKEYPITKINIDKANPTKLGEDSSSNKRTIYKFIDPSVCESCQLLMGLTILEPNNLWNTMPCHTHDRRSEVYLYFDMDNNSKIMHFMGKPEETRHLVISNEQAVISPPWSIHSGVGTSNYTFIWAMLGDNQNYGDMDMISMDTLK